MMFSLGAISIEFGHFWRRHVIWVFHVVFISVLGSEHLESICKLSFSVFPFSSSHFFLSAEEFTLCKRRIMDGRVGVPISSVFLSFGGPASIPGGLFVSCS